MVEFIENFQDYLFKYLSKKFFPGCIIIGFLELLLLFVYMIRVFMNASDPDFGSMLGVSLAAMTIAAIIVSLLIVGVRQERPGYLVPHLVFQVKKTKLKLN